MGGAGQDGVWPLDFRFSITLAGVAVLFLSILFVFALVIGAMFFGGIEFYYGRLLRGGVRGGAGAPAA